MIRFALALAMLAGLVGCGGSGEPKERTVSFGFPLGSLSATGGRVAVAPAGFNPQVGGMQRLPLVTWDAVGGKVARLALPRTCVNPRDVSLAGAGVGLLCDESCCDTVEQQVLLLRGSGPPLVLLRATGGEGVATREVGAVAGAGALLVFDLQERDAKDRLLRRSLVRIDGTELRTIVHGPLAGAPLAVADGRVVVSSPDQGFRILAADGRPLGAVEDYRLDARRLSELEPPIAYDGSHVYEADPIDGEFEGASRIGNIDTPVYQIGLGSILGGTRDGLVAYMTADAVHVLRVSDGRDAIFGLGDGVPAGVDITPAGLFYAANARAITIQDSVEQIDRIHSRLTFVPMQLVLAALGQRVA